MNSAEEMNVIPLPGTDSSGSSNQEFPGTGNLEKIRDILFGSQMRDYDRRFQRIDERIQKETADLRDETRRRFDSLEGYLKQELAALGDRLKAETQQRVEHHEELTRELRDSARNINQRIGQLDEQTSAAARELRERILAQSNELSDEIRRKTEELTAALARESRELRFDKADRSALSNLFTELALRLNNEFKLPGEE